MKIYRYDVFISFTSDDRRAASFLNDELTNRGFTTRFDDMLALDEIDAAGEALRQSATYAVFCGPNGPLTWQPRFNGIVAQRLANDKAFHAFLVLLPMSQAERSRILTSGIRSIWGNDVPVVFEGDLDDANALHSLILNIRAHALMERTLLMHPLLRELIDVQGEPYHQTPAKSDHASNFRRIASEDTSETLDEPGLSVRGKREPRADCLQAYYSFFEQVTWKFETLRRNFAKNRASDLCTDSSSFLEPATESVWSHHVSAWRSHGRVRSVARDMRADCVLGSLPPDAVDDEPLRAVVVWTEADANPIEPHAHRNLFCIHGSQRTHGSEFANRIKTRAVDAWFADSGRTRGSYFVFEEGMQAWIACFYSTLLRKLWASFLTDSMGIGMEADGLMAVPSASHDFAMQSRISDMVPIRFDRVSHTRAKCAALATRSDATGEELSLQTMVGTVDLDDPMASIAQPFRHPDRRAWLYNMRAVNGLADAAVDRASSRSRRKSAVRRG